LMSHFDYSLQPHPFITTNKINNLVRILRSLLPKTEDGEALGKQLAFRGVDGVRSRSTRFCYGVPQNGVSNTQA
jgi:hypothetical protein